MSKFFDYARQIIYLVFLAMLALLMGLDFPAVFTASRQLLGRADALKSVEIADVKISFDSDEVKNAFATLKINDGDVDASKRDRALQLIRNLDQDEFTRLMYVGHLRNLCEYDAPSDAQMRYTVATDYRLVEKKLAEMIDSPDLLTERINYANQQIALTGHADNGRPFHCYFMRLTPDGANVTTALIGSFAEVFDQGSHKPMPSTPRMAQIKIRATP